MIADARTTTMAALAAAVLTMNAAGASAQVYIEQQETRQVTRSSSAASVTAESVARAAAEVTATVLGTVDSYSLRGVTKVVTQTGSDNQVTMAGQNEATSTQLTQSGSRNVILLTNNGTDTSLVILQSGSGNSLTTPSPVSGRGNELLLKQKGDNNEAGVSVTGGSSVDNQLVVSQQGNGNQSSLIVSGRDANVAQSQTGNNLSQSVTHIGNGRTVTIQQFSLQK